jgi:hypothetical protein
MDRRSKSIIAVMFVVVLSLSTSANAIAGAYTEDENTTIPIDFNLFVSCAAGGVGEVVYVTGTLHDMYHVTFDDTGGFHLICYPNRWV